MEWIIENEYSAKGYKIICGTDEAGRGPLCGNVAAGACILPYGVDIPGLNDSKKLTEKKREKLYDIITSSAIAWAVGEASPEEIDDINILNAAQLAMRRAVAGLSVTPDLVLVDGNVARDFPMDAWPSSRATRSHRRLPPRRYSRKLRVTASSSLSTKNIRPSGSQNTRDTRQKPITRR